MISCPHLTVDQTACLHTSFTENKYWGSKKGVSMRFLLGSVTMIVDSTCVFVLPSVTNSVKLYSGLCASNERSEKLMSRTVP